MSIAVADVAVIHVEIVSANDYSVPGKSHKNLLQKSFSIDVGSRYYIGSSKSRSLYRFYYRGRNQRKNINKHNVGIFTLNLPPAHLSLLMRLSFLMMVWARGLCGPDGSVRF